MNHKKEYKRLVEIVKSNRRRQDLPTRHEDIAKILGYDRSYFSSLMGKTGTVTTHHIKLLKLNFPFLQETKKNGNDMESLLKTLISKVDTLININEKLLKRK